MRQTNHAITFLASSYQAVFKHAYVAGLASSAMMLSLGSSYANAALVSDSEASALDHNNLSLQEAQHLSVESATITLDHSALSDQGEAVGNGKYLMLPDEIAGISGTQEYSNSLSYSTAVMDYSQLGDSASLTTDSAHGYGWAEVHESALDPILMATLSDSVLANYQELSVLNEASASPAAQSSQSDTTNKIEYDPNYEYELKVTSGKDYSYNNVVYTAADLTSGGLTGSSTTLDSDKLFVADEALSKSLTDKLSGKSTQLGSIQVNNSILVLDVEKTDILNTSSVLLTNSGITGSGANAVLYSKGTVNFTVADLGTDENLNGFNALVAHNLKFQNSTNAANPDQIVLQSGHFIANKSLATANGETLVLSGSLLQLSGELNVFDVEHTLDRIEDENYVLTEEEERQRTEARKFSNDITVSTDGHLLVDGGMWLGKKQTLIAESNAQVTVLRQTAFNEGPTHVNSYGRIDFATAHFKDNVTTNLDYLGVIATDNISFTDKALTNISNGSWLIGDYFTADEQAQFNVSGSTITTVEMELNDNVTLNHITGSLNTDNSQADATITLNDQTVLNFSEKSSINAVGSGSNNNNHKLIVNDQAKLLFNKSLINVNHAEFNDNSQAIFSGGQYSNTNKLSFAIKSTGKLTINNSAQVKLSALYNNDVKTSVSNINQLEVNDQGTLTLQGSTLNASGAITVNNSGALSFDKSLINTSGSLSLKEQGSLTVTQGNFNAAGEINVQNTGKIELTDNTFKGTAAADINLQDQASFNVHGGSFTTDGALNLGSSAQSLADGDADGESHGANAQANFSGTQVDLAAVNAHQGQFTAHSNSKLNVDSFTQSGTASTQISDSQVSLGNLMLNGTGDFEISSSDLTATNITIATGDFIFTGSTGTSSNGNQFTVSQDLTIGGALNPMSAGAESNVNLSNAQVQAQNVTLNGANSSLQLDNSNLTAQDITVNQGSLVFTGNATNNSFKVSGDLTVGNGSQGTVKLEQAQAEIENLTLAQGANAQGMQVTNSQLTANTMQLNQGQLSMSNSSLDANNLLVTNGSLHFGGNAAADTGAAQSNAEQPKETGSSHKSLWQFNVGTMTIGSSANAEGQGQGQVKLSHAAVNVAGDLTLNTAAPELGANTQSANSTASETASAGLTMTDSTLSAKNIKVINGNLSFKNTGTTNLEFTVDDALAVGSNGAGQGQISIEKADVTAKNITINSAPANAVVQAQAQAAADGSAEAPEQAGIYLTDSTLSTDSLTITNGTFSFSQTADSSAGNTSDGDTSTGDTSEAAPAAQGTTLAADEAQLKVKEDIKLQGTGVFELNNSTGEAKDILVQSQASKFKLDGARFNANDLDNQGQVELTDLSSLYLVGGLTNQGTGQMQLSNSSLEVAGALSNLGTMMLNQSTLVAQNGLTNQAGGNLNLNGSKLQSLNSISSWGNLSTTNAIVEIKGDLDLQDSSVTKLGSNTNLSANHIKLQGQAQLETNEAFIIADTLRHSGSGALNFKNSVMQIEGDDDAATVDFAGQDISLDASILHLGSGSDSLALVYDAETKSLLIGKDSDLKTISGSNGAHVYLDIADFAKYKITEDKIDELRKRIMQGNGIVHISGITIPGLNKHYNDDLDRWEITHKDLEDYLEYHELDPNFSNDDTVESVLVGVDGDQDTVAGGWAAVEVDNGNSFTVTDDKTLALHGSTQSGSQNLAQNQAGDLIGANLGSGSALDIMNSGTGIIGDIVDKNKVVNSDGTIDTGSLDSTLNISNADKVQVEDTDGDGKSSIIVGQVNNNGATIEVDEVITNDASFNNGELVADNVQITGELDGADNNFKVSGSFDAGSVATNDSTFIITDPDSTFTTDSFSGSNNKVSAPNIDLGSLNGSNNEFTFKDFTAGETNLADSLLKGQDIHFTDDATFTDSDISGGEITADGQFQIGGDSHLTADNMVLGSGDFVIGDQDLSSVANPGAKVEIELGNLDLNGNDLMVQTSNNGKATIIHVNTLGSKSTIDKGEIHVNGNLLIGNNSAMGITPDETKSDFYAEVNKHLSETENLNKDDVGALLYIDRPEMRLDDKKLIVGTEDLQTLQEQLKKDPQIYIGYRGAIIITSRAFADADKDNEAIFSDLDENDKIKGSGGSVIVPSLVGPDDIDNIFGDAEFTDDTNLTVRTDNGIEFEVIGNEINTGTSQTPIQPAPPSNGGIGGSDGSDGDSDGSNGSNGAGTGTGSNPDNSGDQGNANNGNTDSSDTNGSTSGSDNNGSGNNNQGTGGSGLQQSDDEIHAILADMSNPTFDYFSKLLHNKAEGIHDPNVDESSEGYLFLSQAGGTDTGRAIEQSARLSAFGMGMQVAHQAAHTADQAISQRLNMSSRNMGSFVPSVITNHSTTLWLTPSYQSYQSEHFRADNLNYGADIDMFGMAAGFDHKFDNGFLIGAMVNYGEGDATGKGIAEGVANNFSYYAAGLYASIEPTRNITISADATYTMIDNEVETAAHVLGYDKITGNVDSTDISVGLNAQYVIRALGMELVPHVGVRYSHVAMDNYDFKVDGYKLGHTETDAMDIVSVPVGVTLAGTIKSGKWQIKPSLDLSVTANINAESFNSQSTFEGIAEPIEYETEFEDDYVYGATAGLSIETESFNFGANVGYQGSSNTDEINAVASMQFKF